VRAEVAVSLEVEGVVMDSEQPDGVAEELVLRLQETADIVSRNYSLSELDWLEALKEALGALLDRTTCEYVERLDIEAARRIDPNECESYEREEM
jgi:hypothetical protein